MQPAHRNLFQLIRMKRRELRERKAGPSPPLDRQTTEDTLSMISDRWERMGDSAGCGGRSWA